MIRNHSIWGLCPLGHLPPQRPLHPSWHLLGTSRPAWPAALPPKCPVPSWSPEAAGNPEPKGPSCRSYPSRGWWQGFLLHE